MVNANDLFNLGPSTDIDPSFFLKTDRSDKYDIQKLAKRFVSEKSEQSFNALMKRCEWGLRSYIFGMTHNTEDTNNIMSITMEHVYFRIDSFNDDIAKFSTWMYRIAHNDTLRYFKAGGLRSKIDIAPLDLHDLKEQVLNNYNTEDDFFDYDGLENMIFKNGKYESYTKNKIMSDMYDASIECLDYIPDHLKIVLKERYIDKKKVHVIAKDNNVSVSSVKNWLRKGRSVLKEEIKNRHEDLCELFDETKIA